MFQTSPVCHIDGFRSIYLTDSYRLLGLTSIDDDFDPDEQESTHGAFNKL